MSLVHGPQPNNIIIGGLPHSSLTAYKHSTVYSLLYVGLPFFEVGDAIHLVAETNRIDVVSIKVLVEDDECNNSHSSKICLGFGFISAIDSRKEW